MFDFRAWLLGYPFRRSVIVVTKTDQSFRGVLWDQAADQLILRATEQLIPHAKPVDLAGEVLIPRANVNYIQVVPVSPESS